MLRVGFALLFGLIGAAVTEAQPLSEAATPLASRISSLLPKRATVSLDLQVLTPLALPESSRFRSAIEAELRKAGVEVTAATPPDSRVRVSISENARGLLVVAEIAEKDTVQVVMQPWSRPAAADAKPALRMIQKPIYKQPEPILDLMVLTAESQLLILSPAKISSFRLANGKWAPYSQALMPLARPVQRDPRGRLQLSAGSLQAYLPEGTCSSQLSPQLALSCSSANEPWPLDLRDSLLVKWLKDRNVLESEGIKSPFFSAAGGVFAAFNESIQERSGNAIPATESWGSDLAAIENPCSSGTVLIVAMAGDKPDHDQVQAFEILAGRPVARSEMSSLPGPVTALWPAETPGQATLVVRNFKTGDYEASRLALACTE